MLPFYILRCRVNHRPLCPYSASPLGQHLRLILGSRCSPTTPPELFPRYCITGPGAPSNRLRLHILFGSTALECPLELVGYRSNWRTLEQCLEYSIVLSVINRVLSARLTLLPLCTSTLPHRLDVYITYHASLSINICSWAGYLEFCNINPHLSNELKCK